MRKLTRSIGFKLFLWLSAVLLIILSIHSYLCFRHQRNLLLQQTTLEATRFADVIRRSTYYSMLLNRKQDIYEIISAIGEQPGVGTIRIFDKNGRVAYSTDSTEIGKRVDVTYDACIGCHANGKTLVNPGPEKRLRMVRGQDSGKYIGMSEPIFNQPECSNAACHAHPADQEILGVLDVTMPMTTFEQVMAARQKEIIFFALVLLAAVTLVIGVFIWRFVHVPIQRLIQGTEQVALGNLDYRIPEDSNDEIGKLARAFNRMTRSLKEANEEIRGWSDSLEKRIKEKTEQLKQAQKHILFVEKMASLGKLSAAVAHELNNPLAGVLNYTKLVQKKIRKRGDGLKNAQDILDDLEVIASETMRCGNIVKNLLLFTREGKQEYQPCNLNEILTQSLKLVQHQLEMQGIEAVLELDDRIEQMYCYPDQLKQAFLALFVNAIEAMPDGGKLHVRTRLHPEIQCVEITISDTGVGIRPEDLPHIFEPFFTTKDEMSGTGLGLSVVYGIVRQHKGSIDVQSEVNHGTTFVIRIPANPEKVVRCEERNELIEQLTKKQEG